MKHFIYLLLTSLLVLPACTSQQDSILEPAIKTDVTRIENDDVIPSSKQNASENIDVDTFNGQWFSIAYPADFIPNPSSPTDIFDDYEFVVTDEAVFKAKNGDVEFFVYSPQWSGNPKSYLKALPNELVESDKTTVDEIDPNRVFRWVTYKDKDDKYKRSFYSKKAESTHLVFGIKYKDQATYDAFKPAYAAFKKSLIQYAD